MRTFTINDVTYTTKPFNFNFLCDLEERGISVDDITNHPMSFIRTYLSICSGKSIDFCGEEIEAHIENGGNFEDIMNAIKEEMETSGFFRTLNKEQKKTSTKGKKSAQEEA